MTRLLAAFVLCLACEGALIEPTVGSPLPNRSAASNSKAYHRIISLYGAHTENLFRLGAGEQVIGVSTHESYPPAALQKAVFSYHDDPEKFLAARPDLVLIRPMIARGYGPLIRRLEQNGIRVISLQPDSADAMFAYWQTLGDLTGRQAQAQDMVRVFKQAAAEIRARTADIDPRKKVYFEAIHRRMKTFAPQAMAIYVLETAGGVNVAADARAVRGTNIAAYGKERILSHAHRIDAYIAQHGVMNPITKAEIEHESGYQAIKAVREGHILIVDEMIVSRPTTRLIEGMQVIGAFLYPQRFREVGHVD
jgi:iron complex transport system substrate-binding protein